MPNLYTYLIAYIVLLLIISWYLSKKQTREDFFISGRNRAGWQILLSKFAAAIGVGWFITYTGFAYEYGMGVFGFLLGAIIGFVLFAYWAAPKIYANSKEKKFYTMGDFMYDKTNSNTVKHTANILSSVILFSWLIIGIIGGAKIINDFGFLPYEIAVFLTAAVVLSYILIAGFKAVIITDIIQSIIIVTLLFVITFGIVGSENIPEILKANTGSIDLGVIIGFFLYGILAVFSSSDRFQLCYSAKNKIQLKHGLGLAILPIIFSAFLLFLIGVFMAIQFQGLDSGLIFTEALKNFLPASLLPIAVVLFFAGIMSSSDTSIYAISSHYALSKKEKTISSIRKAAIALIVINVIIALLYSDIVDISILAGGITLTLSIPSMFIIAGGKRASRFIASVIGGLIGLAIGIAIWGIDPTIAIPTLVLGAIGLLWKRKTKPI